MTEVAHLHLAATALESGDMADVPAHLQNLVCVAKGETKEKAEEIFTLLEDDAVRKQSTSWKCWFRRAWEPT